VQDLDTAAALNDEGFALYEAGDYAGAVEPLRGAVAACTGSRLLDPCGYAIFNLGSSLHRTGQSEEAIPLLEARLKGWDFRIEDVQAELDAARESAGR